MPTTPRFTDTDFWQRIEPAGTYTVPPDQGHIHGYPATLSDGRQLLLPIRERDNGRFALASLIINQASFDVVDTLAADLAGKLRGEHPDIIVGLPTLGLTLAEATARKLGHSRYVPLGTSRKFWYNEDLSVPMSSITSPDSQKRLYIDPRLVGLLHGQRICVIDDVISTGSSVLAALKLLARTGIAPDCLGFAMCQSTLWCESLATASPGLETRVFSAFDTPRLKPVAKGGWLPE
ncbi:phosphoribosyltransferase [Granulosicoccus sp. 3-233]|uniref:phosphoribosyltransferase n=1 Tax=Granulosicoccus sp. 3-233 TaxID=3417969 RepID=UPI003D344CC9